MQYRRLIFIAIALTLTVCTVGSPRLTWAQVNPVAHRVALGVATPGVTPMNAHPGIALDRYAAEVGRMPSIVMWYETWYGGPLIAKHLMQVVANRGVTPMITWLPKTGPGRSAPLTRIAAGDYDGYLKASAVAARAFGRRILLRPFSEMNGRWMLWGVGYHGNTAAEFIAAWRHIVNVFRAEGATNVKFVFSPNVISSKSPNFTPEYPGDNYVNRVALDGYNWGTVTSVQRWRSFANIFGRSYRVMTQLTQRPLIIAETASTERGGNKALWITHAFHRGMAGFPRIRSVIWFNRVKETNWQINSSRASLHAYRLVVKAE